MTDKDRDLVEELLARAHPYNVDVTDRAAARIETQAREIGRLRLALGLIAVFGPEAVAGLANQALEGDSHDQ